MPVLRQAIADHQRRFYGLDVDPDGEVLVTAGATEALAGALLGMLDTGDEVVVFEPMYDSYQACIALAGAIARPVVLRPGVGPDGQYGFDRRRAARRLLVAHQARACSTRPHNPTGKVFTRDELTFIADLAQRVRRRSSSPTRSTSTSSSPAPSTSRWPRCPAWPIARSRSRPAARRSTRPVGRSDGSCGPAAAGRRHQDRQAVPHLRQRCAVPAGDRGRARAAATTFFAELAADLEAKRDHLFAGLVAAGFDAFRPEATYFTTVDIRPVAPDGDGYRLLPCDARADRRGGDPEPGVLRQPGARPAPGAVRLLQAARGHRRRRRTTGATAGAAS